MTLPDIKARFLRLPETDRILLLEYLADAGGIELDTPAAALEWARSKWSDDDRVLSEADNLVPQGRCDRSVWELHRSRRDFRLASILSASDREAA